jgi:serine/threonine-protein kinase
MSSASERRWSEIRQRFDEARSLSAAERERWLERLGVEDAELAAELVAMFAADSRLGDRIERGVGALADDAPEGAAAPGGRQTGRRLGAWTLGELLGTGGMGTVYAAERSDGAFEQAAAVKLLRRSVDTEEGRLRFLRERQVLARLDHPAIVRVLDGGVSGEGEPWFALERVRGVAITRFVAEHGLELRPCLELFLQVCDAVDAAHRQLVVHRDLKPANVLVTDDGRVKLLDFGIAKLLEDDVGLTRTDERLLTPEYAAPEQLRGEAVATTTDVYALGVLLHQLLCGELPYDARGRSISEILVARERGSPPLPSATLRRRGDDRENQRRAAAVAGDLDAIVAKALRPEPEARYGSAAALSTDLRRALDGRPVEARAGTRRYRLARFVRRHRTAVALGGFAAAALVLGLMAALAQARIARVERDRARVAAARAEAVAGFLSGLFRDADPARTRGDKLTALELLERGAEQIERELGAEPEVRAALDTILGGVLRDLGRNEPARRSLERALAEREARYGADAQVTADTLHELAVLDRIEGRFDEAAARAQRALAIRERTLAPDHVDLARTCAALGTIHRVRGESAEARRLLERAVAIGERLQPRPAEAGRWQNNLGLVLLDAGEVDGARAAFERSLAWIEAADGPRSPLLALPLDNLGNALRQLGRQAEALPRLVRALELVEASWGASHPQYGTALNSLGDLLSDLGRNEEAIPHLRRAAEVDRVALGEVHPWIAWPLTNEAECLVALGRPREAIPLIERALALRRKSGDEESSEVALSIVDLGKAKLAAGDLAGAEPLLVEGLAKTRTAFEPTSLALAETLVALADCRERRGDRAEAHALWSEALPIFRSALPAGHASLVAAESAIARLARAL